MTIKNKLVKIFKMILIISFIIIYISINLTFKFNLFEKITILAGLILLYSIFIILLDELKKTYNHKIVIENKIPKPQKKYLGSNQTKTYHINTCRFSKLIKPNYKIETDNNEYFKKIKFAPCKICKPHLHKN